MSEDIDEAAARWHTAQAADDMDWDGFTLWLEADSRHRLAFEEIALLDARLDRSRDLLRTLVTPTEAPAPRRGMRLLGWGSAAAAAVAAALILTLQSPAPDTAPRYVDHFAPAGEGRSVQLADGSAIAVDPGSSVRVGVDRGDPIVLQGRAVFTVRHDANTPMVVRAGPYEVRDIGTIFEISSADDALRVAVSQGQVSVRAADGSRMQRVSAGQSLSALHISTDWQLGTVRPEAVAPWRKGPLVYEAVPLKLVAADIARITGARLTIDADVAQRRFSGVIASGSRDAMANSLSQLTGLTVRKEADAVRLGSGVRR